MDFYNIFYPILEYITKGGIVMYPLIFVSLIMWVLIIERLIVFKRLYARGITKKRIKRNNKRGK